MDNVQLIYANLCKFLSSIKKKKKWTVWVMKLIDSTGADLCKFMQIMHQFPDDFSWALLRQLTEHKAPKKKSNRPIRPWSADLCKFMQILCKFRANYDCHCVLNRKVGIEAAVAPLYTRKKKVSSPPEVWLPASGFRTVANHSGFCFFLFFFVFLCCF